MFLNADHHSEGRLELWEPPSGVVWLKQPQEEKITKSGDGGMLADINAKTTVQGRHSPFSPASPKLTQGGQLPVTGVGLWGRGEAVMQRSGMLLWRV